METEDDAKDEGKETSQKVKTADGREVHTSHLSKHRVQDLLVNFLR